MTLQYDNPVRIDKLIGRIPGFTNVPVLFVSILATGVLDTTVINFPPNGLKPLKEEPQKAQDGSANAAPAKSDPIPKLGMGIDACTAKFAPELIPIKSSSSSETAPEGFS